MTSAQASAVLATVGAAFLAQSIVCTSLFRRVRALTARVTSTDPDDLAAQLRSVEARLARLEAARERKSPDPTESKRRRLDRRQVASSDGPVLIAVPSLASTPSATLTEAAEEFDRRFGSIWALSDSGTSTDEIARATGYPVGQVELILGLRPPKRSGASGSEVEPDA